MDGAMPSLIPGAPTFTPVASRLLDLLANEDAVVEQVAALLRLEPAFVAEVLQMASTPVFGFQRQIRNLAHVVASLGTQRLRALIATVALRQSSGTGGPLCGYWRHSVAAGFLAAELAPGWALDPDQAYTAAVMHDNGAWDSRGGIPVAPWSTPCEEADGQSLAGMEGFACGFSEVLGFPIPLHASPPAGLEELLSALPQTARICFPSDLTRLARHLEGKIATINN
jgi:hypothetical protein